MQILLKVVYSVPLFIVNLLFYLYTKQTSLIRKMILIVRSANCCTNKSNHRKPQLVYAKYVRVNRSYGKLLCEINDYNQIISRYLDIIFLLFIAIIAYFTFLLYFNKTYFLITAVFTVIYMSHIMILSIVILTSASITTGNEAMSKQTLQLFNISLKRHYHTVQLIKVCIRGVV